VSGDRVAVPVYRALVKLYPRRFRGEYGDDMVVMFRDQCRDESVRGAFRRATLDLAITIPAQHLEAVMRRSPQALVPLIYMAVALAGLATAIAGGTDPSTIVIGLAVTLIAGTIGVVAWRRSVPVRGRSLTSSWWMFLGTGPGLVAVVITAAALGVEAWFLGMMTLLLAFVLIIVGLGLGIAHVLNHRDRQDPPVTFNAG
jgi:hypothetical protein